MMIESNRVYTTTQAAKLLCTTNSTLLKMVDRGMIKCSSLLSHKRFLGKHLLEWLESPDQHEKEISRAYHSGFYEGISYPSEKEEG